MISEVRVSLVLIVANKSFVPGVRRLPGKTACPQRVALPNRRRQEPHSAVTMQTYYFVICCASIADWHRRIYSNGKLAQIHQLEISGTLWQGDLRAPPPCHGCVNKRILVVFSSFTVPIFYFSLLFCAFCRV